MQIGSAQASSKGPGVPFVKSNSRDLTRKQSPGRPDRTSPSQIHHRPWAHIPQDVEVLG